MGGAISATAQLYTGPITLTQGEEINARVYSGATWSRPRRRRSARTCRPCRVTEVMYDPLPATAAEIAAGYVVSDTREPWKDFQFIEIQNTGTQAVAAGRAAISGGITFTFPRSLAGRRGVHRGLLRHGRLRHPLRDRT